MLDTYVCVSCAGSADSNPGTQASPFRTIARGIAVAQMLSRPTVFVGGAQGMTTTYAEAINIPAGVVVQGRWVVTGASTWTRNGNRTALLNLSPAGVTFSPTAGRTAGLDGMRVISSGAIAGATAVAAVTILDASPTLYDVQIDPPTGNLTPPTTAAAISISSGSSTGRANPRIAGVNAGSRSVVTSGAATTSSYGIAVTNATAEVEFVDVRGGNTTATTGLSAGMLLSGAAGTTVRTSLVASGTASNGTCAGLASNGDASGVIIEQADLRGCTGIPNPLATPTASVGVSFTSCPPPGPGSAQPRLAGSVVQGGVAEGMNSYVIGVLANDGCGLNIDANTITGSNAVTIVPVSAVGIVCTSELQSGVSGANAACRVVNNRANAGRAQQASIGLACIGNCSTGNAACRGSCTEVMTNTARGENARAVFHGFISQSSPIVARNTFGTDTAACTTSGMGGGPLIYGLRVEGSASRIENNLVIGGQCPTTIGFEQSNVVRSGDMSTPAPDVHSNTIVPTTPAGISMNALIAGVIVRSNSPTPLPPLGTYRNNIITALGFASARLAFQEADTNSDPAVLENNNFWTGPSPIGMAPLYQNEGMTMLNSAAQINALNGGGVTSNNNMSTDPGFAANYRLGAMSLMRSVGTSTGAPVDDIDGQRRPNPVGNPPDVGCDEVP